MKKYESSNIFVSFTIINYKAHWMKNIRNNCNKKLNTWEINIIIKKFTLKDFLFLFKKNVFIIIYKQYQHFFLKKNSKKKLYYFWNESWWKKQSKFHFQIHLHSTNIFFFKNLYIFYMIFFIFLSHIFEKFFNIIIWDYFIKRFII